MAPACKKSFFHAEGVKAVSVSSVVMERTSRGAVPAFPNRCEASKEPPRLSLYLSFRHKVFTLIPNRSAA